MRTTSKLLWVAGALTATAAFAWNYEYSWYDPAANTPTASQKPGGGGNCGTAGKVDAQVKCDHCHIPPTTGPRIDAGLTFSPPLLANGRYAPNTAYAVTVTLGGEHIFNPDGGPSANGFAGRFETAPGQIAGTLDSDTPGFTSASCQNRAAVLNVAGLSGTTVVYGDCRAVLHREKLGITQWSFTWNSPQSDAGVVTFFYGVVDGVGNDRTRKSDGGANDDVRSARVVLNP